MICAPIRNVKIQDITQQMLKDRRAVDLVEKCTRLHVFAAYKLAKLEFSDFNQKMNTGMK